MTPSVRARIPLPIRSDELATHRLELQQQVLQQRERDRAAELQRQGELSRAD
jgi:hypothetical protein